MRKQIKPYQIANQMQKEVEWKLYEAELALREGNKEMALKIIKECIVYLEEIKELRNMKYPRD